MSKRERGNVRLRKPPAIGGSDPVYISECNQTAASSGYCRERDLPFVLALWPEEVRDTSEAGTRKVIEKLRSALRAERQRGRAGHWSYDLDRHLKLALALKAECAALKLLTGSRGPKEGSN